MNFKRMAMLSGVLLLASGLAVASQQQITGIVSDSMCGAKHMAKDKNAAECTRMCIKQGMKYPLVAGDKVYNLNGHEPELDRLAGSRATVTGNVVGDVLSVQSVEPAK